MNLIQLCILIVVLGVIYYLVDKYIPMDAMFKTLLRIVVVVVVILILLSFVFDLGSIGNIRVGR